MIIRKGVSRILRNYRDWIDKYIYKDYDDNPLQVKVERNKERDYLRLADTAKQTKDAGFINLIREEFGIVIEDEFIDDLALTTQIVIKQSAPLYLHGYLLYGAVRKYCDEHKNLRSVNILETGTARGFSAVVMAKGLYDSKILGKIVTLDILPPNKSIYWNCIRDAEGKKTRFELLGKWLDLVEDYIVFIQGYSDITLKRLSLPMIHFAFLDGGHDYHTVKNELSYVKAHQTADDVIVCDDYSEQQFPGLVKAVDEFISEDKYRFKSFRSASGRGYVWLSRKE